MIKKTQSKFKKKIFFAILALMLGNFTFTSLHSTTFAKENIVSLSEEQVAKLVKSENKVSGDLIVQTSEKQKKKISQKKGRVVSERKAEQESMQVGKQEAVFEKESEKEKINEAESLFTPQSIVVSVAGDCTMGSYLEENQVFDPEYREPGSYEAYYQAYGPEYFFKNVKEIFSKDDFTWINLEGPLSNDGPTEEKSYPIRCHPEEINTLKAGFVEICNLANNHIYDCGWKGFTDTVNILRENDLGFTGEGYTYTAVKNGIKITFLGYTSFATNSELFDIIKKDIDEARLHGSNVIMVQFHGGEERIYYPPEDQKEVFRYTIDSGADVVVGAHPHVMQGIEMYKGKPICYSMGNFSFGANWNPKDKDTFIYQARFTLNKDRTVALTKQQVIPCRISSVEYRNDFCPTVLRGEDGRRVLNRLKDYSSIFAVPYDFTADFEALDGQVAAVSENQAQ